MEYPGSRVRRTVNRVEMSDGESLIIGGLLDRRITKSLNKFPLLGDVPILGALFRSTQFPKPRVGAGICHHAENRSNDEAGGEAAIASNRKIR